MRGKANPKVPAGKATDMFRFLDFCAAHGVDAEPTTYFFAEETDAYLLRLRRHAFLRGVALSRTHAVDDVVAKRRTVWRRSRCAT
jgi:hypothetical protein